MEMKPTEFPEFISVSPPFSFSLENRKPSVPHTLHHPTTAPGTSAHVVLN